MKHDNIINYYGVIIEEKTQEAQIFMEYMPSSLLNMLKEIKGNRFHENIIRVYTIQILKALDYLHNRE